jgi:ribosomal protein S18 acetylase RimI-like enzyme
VNPYSIRTFTRNDIEFALAQTAREGWDSTAEHFETCVAHEPDGCYVAQTGGRRVGMITTIRYGRTGWIGNLIVPPDCRRRGIGADLMAKAMNHLSSPELHTLRLEADPLGIGLYRRLGFVDEFESLRFQLPPGRSAAASVADRITQADLPAIAACDAEYFGDRRDRLLALLFQRSLGAYVVRGGGEVRGYILAFPSSLGLRIGPWIAADLEIARTLLESMLAERPDAAVILGVPCRNRSAIRLLESYGFSPRPSSLRMVYGLRGATGRPENVFAIANGAMG